MECIFHALVIWGYYGSTIWTIDLKDCVLCISIGKQVKDPMRGLNDWKTFIEKLRYILRVSSDLHNSCTNSFRESMLATSMYV